MDPNRFAYTFSVRLHDTDAAGRLFFGHLFRHAHDAYEAFMAQAGLPLERLIREGELLLPLVHAEADYHRPLCQGDRVQISLAIEEIRTRSFAVGYRFETQDGTLAATAKTVHLQINRDGSPASCLSDGILDAIHPYTQNRPQ
ncbi:acyl-CoA thioesterase [Thiocapsa rosea]|uniref:1,4-dihydroxy-2-naphthoyl-CoA hydrolase n=1 Tax=Thiocapsa rosea TaxID=69360 RepID=A0A495V4Z3_9GAMM|nr:acyl-CoA thioesterase [Thiocapsa rosea]RKT43665.1 1,4-dihydroxy-2-naphthoyl-CoA hydrolase [Thiocapsa rosea]